MLRLYAMYSSSKRILAILVSGFTAVVIAEIVIIVLSTKAQIGEPGCRSAPKFAIYSFKNKLSMLDF